MYTFTLQGSFGAVLVLIGVLDQYQILFAFDAAKVPCHFYNSVNITDGHQLENGSYFHDDVVYPADLVRIYDYTYQNDLNRSEKQPTKPHLRGCICQIKNCTRLCCPRGSRVNADKKKCDYLQIDDDFYVINVTVAEDSYKVEKLSDLFFTMYGKPCDKIYLLEPHEYEVDRWEIFPNGNIEVIESKRILTKDQYCLTPQASGTNSSTWVLQPYVCFIGDETQDKLQYIQGVAIFCSIPFMIITVLVYTVIPELRTLHGNCLCCHLLSMIISEFMLAYMKYKAIERGVLCWIFAYSSYFFILAAFFWLNVISFDLWLNLCGTMGSNRQTNKKQFLFYSLYSWGMPLGFSVLATILQNTESLPTVFKIGFGEGDHCFVAAERWIQILYLYGPILIIILANGVMFIMTALKIHKVQMEMNRVTSSENSKKNLKQEKSQNGLFLKLFLIMGVTWSMETISWMAGSRLKWFFIIADLCNALMGVIIFFLFVFKKKIKTLIMKRCRSLQRKSDATSSVRTANSTTTSTT